MEHVFTRMFCYSCEGAVSCENGASGLSGSDLFFCFCFLFFNSNGRTAQGTVNEVNAIYGEDAPHMTLLNIGIASSSESEICGNGFYPSATPVCH